ncbi:MAG: glycosyltransferase family 4 protein [Armatimonadota bacterium]
MSISQCEEQTTSSGSLPGKPTVLLVVASLRIGGAEWCVLSLSHALKSRGYRVILASGRGILAKSIANKLGITHFYVNMRFYKPLGALMLRIVARRAKVDLVHANMTTAGKCVAKMCEQTGLPWVMTAHSLFGHSPSDVVLAQTDRMMCVSQYLSDWAAANTNVPKDKLVTIYNGIDMERFTPRGQGAGFRRKWKIPEDRFLIGIIARIYSENHKGHRDLIHLLAERPEAKSWHLAVAGEGKALPGLRRMVSNLGLTDRVHFLGNLVDITPVLDAIDAMALPSDKETFGLAIAEAMAMAKPVVAYSVGGIPEIVIDGHTGFLIPSGDIDGLAEKLNLLSKDPDMRKKLGQQGRTRVAESFNIEQMTDCVEQVYNQVLIEHHKADKI